MKSISRMEFFTTIPARRIMPIMDGMQPFFFWLSILHQAPLRAWGIADTLVNGLTQA